MYTQYIRKGIAKKKKKKTLQRVRNRVVARLDDSSVND